jgi:hypothetical protein
MGINMNMLGATKAKKGTTIMDNATFLNKGIHIPDPGRFMWI